jgi:hypothetical protein
VDHVNAFALPLKVASWKWEIFGCKRMNLNMGAIRGGDRNFCPENRIKEEKFRLIEL